MINLLRRFIDSLKPNTLPVQMICRSGRVLRGRLFYSGDINDVPSIHHLRLHLFDAKKTAREQAWEGYGEIVVDLLVKFRNKWEPLN